MKRLAIHARRTRDADGHIYYIRAGARRQRRLYGLREWVDPMEEHEGQETYRDSDIHAEGESVVKMRINGGFVE